MKQTFECDTELTLRQCPQCAVQFCMPKIIYEDCYDNGGFFSCPNGHSRGWSEGHKERENIRRERDLLKQQVAQKNDEIKAKQRELEEERHQSSAIRAEVTKLKSRAKHGVCPCCNRQFKDLESHMNNKHPDFDPKVISINKPSKKSVA